MKHPERVAGYLEHIAQAIQRTAEYIERLGSVSAFRQSQRDQDAVIRNIEIIGEAARQIQKHAPEFVTAHPELPWIEMRGMRNKMIHDYFDVDVNVVWSTVKDDLPRLKQQIDRLLKPEPDPSR
ncbi:MAG: HepT-like ribonuclease domain-containing protein [Methylocella sp.]